MQKAILIVFLYLLHPPAVKSQSTVSPVTPATLNIGGGSAALSPGFTVDWSIGESTIIDTYHGINLNSNSNVGINWYVTSGILQPFDNIHVIFNPLVQRWTNQEIRFYPVPTRNIVSIDFRSTTTGKISIQLFGPDNKYLGVKEIYHANGNSTQQWDLTNKAAGVYHFRIFLRAANGDILKQGTFNIERL
jgi:hypothetical protein